jgi:hypothetical protein
MAWKVDGDTSEIIGKPLDLRVPHPEVGSRAVDEHERMPVGGAGHLDGAHDTTR